METREKARQFLHWYDGVVRDFLAQHAPEVLNSFDNDSARLKSILESPDETTVCVLGMSGIGKSTLLNVLVAGDRTIVPAGGIGPLTALATEMRFSAEPTISVLYHTKQHLWRVAFALNMHVSRLRNRIADTDKDEHFGLEDDDRKEIAESVSNPDPENHGSSRIDEYRRLATLMVCGSQHADKPIEYLADCLTVACNSKPKWGTSPSDEDSRRVSGLREALQKGDSGTEYKRAQGDDRKGFLECLSDHAAGYLAPLISRIHIGWPAESLKTGLVLVDLPGVGIANDVYRSVTQNYIRQRAKAVLMVVDRAGPTEPVMNLIRTTGYWDRLVLSSDDPESDPCSLMLVVTRVDDLANEEWQQQVPDADGRRARKKAEIFSSVRERLCESMTAQFSRQLDNFLVQDGSPELIAAAKIAHDSIISNLEVHPLSAPEFRRLKADNDEDRSFLKSEDETGVPLLLSSLEGFSKRQLKEKEIRLVRILDRISESILNQIKSIESKWRDSDRASEEAKRIREALDVILDEKRKEYATRVVTFREFLQNTVPEKIKVAILEARLDSQKSVQHYLRKLREAHWTTLRAAVVRGGTFFGARQIDLPSDIAVRFQEPVAAIWSQRLLKEIRQQTYDLAKDSRSLVEELCVWAAENAGAFSDPKVIDTQRKLVSSQVEQLREVGKEAIDELRAVVKTKVVAVIEKPIRNSCKRFVDEGDAVGRGVRLRILELFDRLADSSSEAARKPAEETLLAQYELVRQEIQKAFKDLGNPLEATANAIVERHEERTRRSESQKRGKVLAGLQAVTSQAPEWLLSEPG